MTTLRHLIKQHKRCLQLLRAIKVFNKRIELNRDSINGFPGEFPELRKKYLHRIEIIRMAIARLEKVYGREMEKLTERQV